MIRTQSSRPFSRGIILLVVGIGLILFFLYPTTLPPSPTDSFPKTPSTLQTLPSIEHQGSLSKANVRVPIRLDETLTPAESALLTELGLKKFKISNRVFYFFERQEGPNEHCRTLMGPYPLIVVLHGMGGNALEYAQQRTSWIALARKECLSIAFPQALPSPFDNNNVTIWGGQGHSSIQQLRKVEGDNGNRKQVNKGDDVKKTQGGANKEGGEEEHDHLEEEVDWDDTVFIQVMMDSLIEQFQSSIDRNAVFAVGVSNGGFFLCDALGPSKIASLFSGACFMVAGCSMMTPQEAKLEMERSKLPSVPILLILGTLDLHHYRYGRKAEQVFKTAGFEDTTLIQVRRPHAYYRDLELLILRYFQNPNKIQDILKNIPDLEDSSITSPINLNKQTNYNVVEVDN